LRDMGRLAVFVVLAVLSVASVGRAEPQGSPSLEAAESYARIDDLLSRGNLAAPIKRDLTAQLASFNVLRTRQMSDLMIQDLGSGDVDRRSLAIKLVGLLRLSRARTQVFSKLKHVTANERCLTFYAACRTGRLGDAKYLAQYAENQFAGKQFRQGTDYLVPITNIGFYGSRLSKDVLAILLDSKSSEVRYSATLALGQTNDPQAISILRKAFSDRDSRVRASAVSVSKSLGTLHVDGLALHYP